MKKFAHAFFVLSLLVSSAAYAREEREATMLEAGIETCAQYPAFFLAFLRGVFNPNLFVDNKLVTTLAASLALGTYAYKRMRPDEKRRVKEDFEGVTNDRTLTKMAGLGLTGLMAYAFAKYNNFLPARPITRGLLKAEDMIFLGGSVLWAIIYDRANDILGRRTARRTARTIKAE